MREDASRAIDLEAREPFDGMLDESGGGAQCHGGILAKAPAAERQYPGWSPWGPEGGRHRQIVIAFVV